MNGLAYVHGMRRIPVFEGANVSLMQTFTTSPRPNHMHLFSHRDGSHNVFVGDFAYDSKFAPYPTILGQSSMLSMTVVEVRRFYCVMPVIFGVAYYLFRQLISNFSAPARPNSHPSDNVILSK